MARGLIIVSVTAVAGNLAMMLSGYRLLLEERIVHPGEKYLAGEWGDVGEDDAHSLVCRYWTGRSVKPMVVREWLHEPGRVPVPAQSSRGTMRWHSFSGGVAVGAVLMGAAGIYLMAWEKQPAHAKKALPRFR